MSWTNSKPSDNDLLRDIAAQWRGDKKSLTSFLDSFVYWSSTGSAGVPHTTARIPCIPRSEMSKNSRYGLFYITDERRLVYQDSSGSQCVIGGSGGVVSLLTMAGTSASQPTIKENVRTVVEYGSATTTNGNILIANVTLKNTYITLPKIFVTSSSTQPTVSSAASYTVGIDQRSGLTSQFSCTAHWMTASSNTVNDIRWLWRSVGTIAL